jgi:hypothetical protein
MAFGMSGSVAPDASPPISSGRYFFSNAQLGFCTSQKSPHPPLRGTFSHRERVAEGRVRGKGRVINSVQRLNWTTQIFFADRLLINEVAIESQISLRETSPGLGIEPAPAGCYGSRDRRERMNREGQRI